MVKSIFTSLVSFEEAALRAARFGFTPIGQAMNPRGEFVVFARKYG